MRTSFAISLAVLTTAAVVSVTTGIGQQPAPSPAPPASPRPTLIPAKPLYVLDEAFLRWPLPASEKVYGAIEGARMKPYVNELVQISRRSKARGEKLWGRIIGTEADRETQEWLLGKFRALGLSNVRSQSLPLQPQWYPQDWEVTAMVGGKTVPLETAQPTGGETKPGGVELEAVWVGLGTAADFAGRDVRGKAVFIHAVPYPGVWRHSATIYGALTRAQERGAAAIITVIAIPGNVRTQRGHTRAGAVPVFSMGMQDGEKMRELIEQAPAATPARVKVRLEGKEVPGLTTANIWGELPGTTDEKIILLAHRDGYFDAASDNASGVASMLGLAEYFSKIPQAKRRRTIQFIGTPGHHGSVGLLGARALLEHKETALANTALIINLEHTSSVQLYAYGYGAGGGPMIRKANTMQAFWWYAGGSPRFQQMVLKSFDTFGVPTYEEPDIYAQGEMGDIYQLAAASVQLIEANMYYHSDHETAETVPATGLEASTRAYAKIIDEVNTLTLKELQPRSPSDARR